LVKACRALVKSKGAPVKVYANKKVVSDATRFGLDNQSKIIDFVSGNVFPDLEHENTNELDSDHPDAGITFDAYYFRINPSQYIYFAFYKKPNGNWIIKSFHPPTKGPHAPPLCHTPFAMLKEQ
jgi:hypothetical protein